MVWVCFYVGMSLVAMMATESSKDFVKNNFPECTHPLMRRQALDQRKILPGSYP